ncbi:WAT1-related protein At1g68170-like [Andrographis paniculata]|uniref:WAT1-related protein At1g68170-like n=1 Tax=Andrographis paniculata TaxID=175694 RepID=UPI0021E77AAB|nr:WAT1-related protein At1g68170-like [Andrographis paniculata]
MGGGSLSKRWRKGKPVAVMVMVEAVFALVNILYKLAANDNMNPSLIVAYRFMFGAAFIGPIAFFVERKKRPKLSWKISLCGFLCGLFGGSLGQNLYLRGMVMTSATFCSAMTNLIPAITFLVGIILRIEKLAWNTVAGKAKVFGTILGIGGAMFLTLYKGPDINYWDTNINLLTMTSTHHNPQMSSSAHSHGSYILGATLAIISCFFYALWLITQAKASKFYPCPYSITAMMTLSASTQGLLFALCIERDWSQWHLGWDIRLLAVSVAGVLGSGVMFTWVAWCVEMKGPHFVSTFQPLMLLMVAFCGSLFLEERLHMGIVIGGVLIVGGLYVVLWGKNKEAEQNSRITVVNDVEDQVCIDALSPYAGEKAQEENLEEER